MPSQPFLGTPLHGEFRVYRLLYRDIVIVDIYLEDPERFLSDSIMEVPALDGRILEINRFAFCDL